MSDTSFTPELLCQARNPKPFRALDLRIYPDSILRQLCEPVERFDGWLSDVLDEMFSLMRLHEGIGLAAPQAGISQRFLVAQIEDQTLILVNPSIVSQAGRVQMVEGCLSLPDVRVNMERIDRIDVSSYDHRGRKKKDAFWGLWARVVQHEIDHLDGVLICDYKDLNSPQEKTGL